MFLLLERRRAIVLNVLFIAALAPLVVHISGFETAARFVPALVMVVVLAYLFRTALDTRASDLNQRLEEVQRANAAKSEFVANMSHEMRTPLTTVKGYAESVLAQCDEDDPKRESLIAIALGARHLGNLIQDVLDLSRIENDNLELAREKIEVATLVAEVVQMLRNAAEIKGIELMLERNLPLPRYVWTDATRLSQILVNLVGNAIKFTDSGSVKVVVEHEGDDNALWVTVIDTGIGVPEEFREELFERFSQADATMTRRFGGAGLGLFISQRLASLLGGRIEYVPNETGSIFRLVLALDSPVEEWITSDDTAPRLEAANVVHDELLEGNVLIAEDNLSNRLLIGMMLEKLGLRFATADDGLEAVDKVRDESYDVVLMDLQMPLKSGVEAAAEITSFNPSIPIVAVSADVLRHDPDSEEMKPFAAMLAKPIDLEKLRSVLTRLLRPDDTTQAFDP